MGDGVPVGPFDSSVELGILLGSPMSPSNMSLARGAITGMYLRRNLRLRRVTRRDPSTLTTYWSYWRTSMTTPVYPISWDRDQLGSVGEHGHQLLAVVDV